MKEPDYTPTSGLCGCVSYESRLHQPHVLDGHLGRVCEQELLNHFLPPKLVLLGAQGRLNQPAVQLSYFYLRVDFEKERRAVYKNRNHATKDNFGTRSYKIF